MTHSLGARPVAGICMAVVVLVPPVAPWLEARMLGHMLLQIPVLLIAGALVVGPVRDGVSAERWNLAGVPGLLAVSLVLSFWMMPIALDHAVASAGWDTAKVVSLLLGGAVAALSWRVAPLVIQAFFVGNLVWMSIAIGMLYQDDGPRLCNAYLQDDQGDTGFALVMLALAAAGLWMGRTAIRLQKASPRIGPPSGDTAQDI